MAEDPETRDAFAQPVAPRPRGLEEAPQTFEGTPLPAAFWNEVSDDQAGVEEPVAAQAPKRMPPGERRLALLDEFLSRFIDEGARGVEIGPYDKPIFSRERHDMIYADVFSTEELREMASANAKRTVENVVDVELVLRDQTLATAIGGRNVEFVFGSHVYEHLPDLIGFLGDVARAMKPGGMIVGAFPDRRYTFDIDRPRTTLGQLIERQAQGLTAPTPDMVFDHVFHFRRVTSPAIWVHGEGAKPDRLFDMSQALAAMQRAREGYQDAHCNLFTDDEFVEAIGTLSAAGMLPLSVKAIRPTVRPFNEFFFALEIDAR